MVGGLFAYSTLNIEAYPDPVPPLVDIITQNPGQSSEEIERYITVPIEIQMAGLPYVQAIAHHLAVRPLRREGAVHLRRHLPAGLAARDQPPGAAAAAAQRRAAGAVADQPDRRDLPLPRRRPARLQRHRPQDHPGLGPAAPLQGDPRRDRRHRLGRQDQDLRHHDRPRPAAGLRPHPEAGARRAEQRQHQCRRQHGEHRLAVGDRALGRPDPLDGRHPQHHAVGARRRAGAGVRRRDRDGRQPAAARHRGPERRRRHRPGHRADAARRGDPADPDRRAGRGRAGSTAATCCRPASASSGSTTAARWSTSPPTPCCTTC